MSLREEIKSGVEELKKNEDLLCITSDDVIDIAFAKFEKRIDIMIQECKDREKQYPIAINYRIQPLLELKEMLK